MLKDEILSDVLESRHTDEEQLEVGLSVSTLVHVIPMQWAHIGEQITPALRHPQPRLQPVLHLQLTKFKRRSGAGG